MRRRDLLIGSAAAAGLGVLGSRSAWAAPWADGPTEAQSLLLGTGVKAEKCLEIFLYGGLSQYESFYVVDEYGRPDDPTYPDQQWHLFRNDHNRIFSNQCGIPSDQWLQPFATDGNGMTVNLGPLVMPLRNRPDILERMRVVVMRHDLEPHEAAIPYMLAGFRLGNIRMTGMGSHVQRYFQDRDTTGRVTPYSWVFTPDTEFNTDNLRAASSVGLHPGSARPLALKITNTNTLPQMLSRSHLTDTDRPRVDALLDFYAQQMDERYSDLAGDPLRSAAIADHFFALDSIENAPDLSAVIGDDLLDPVGGSSCTTSSSLDHTRVGIRAAAQLLNNPVDPARYVNVIDAGLTLADGGGGYDTHFEHPETQTHNALSLFQNLADHINEPGENDPDKIDLDDTMVLITTEFGRTPFIQLLKGTNHHPYGYIAVIIGGPIGPDQAGVVGTLGPDATAEEWVTPSELRAACLAGMGIWPFSQESFAVGDIRDIGSELDGLAWCNEHVLGRV